MKSRVYELNEWQKFEIEPRLFKYQKVLKNGCWNWTGFINARGYGWTSYQHVSYLAHRLSYMVFIGPVPNRASGLQLDHLCRNKKCFNPRHLEIVTPRVNTLRAPDAPATLNLAKSICVRGHELTPKNLQIKNGHRICLECRKIYNKDTYARLYSCKANGGTCKVILKRRGLL